MSNDTSPSFLRLVAVLTVGLVALAGLLNFSVDPYGLLGRNRLGIFVSNERITLPGLVNLEPHDVMLLGNSRIAYVDPDEVGCEPVFNGAFGGAQPEEILSFLQEFGAGTRVAAIGFDLIMFDAANRPWQAAPFDPETRLSPLAYVFSLDVVGDSLKTIQESRAGEPFALSPNGQRNPEEEWTIHRALEAPDYTRVLEHMADRYRNYIRSDRRLATLVPLREWIDANEVTPVAFLNPLHPEIRELLESHGRGEELAAVRAAIRNVFPDLVDLTRSEWSAPEGFFRHDPYHFKPETGAAFLRPLLAASAPEACGRNAPSEAGAKH